MVDINVNNKNTKNGEFSISDNLNNENNKLQGVPPKRSKKKVKS